MQQPIAITHLERTRELAPVLRFTPAARQPYAAAGIAAVAGAAVVFAALVAPIVMWGLSWVAAGLR